MSKWKQAAVNVVKGAKAKAVAVGTGAMVLAGSAMAGGGGDPSTEIVASITTGRTYGVAAATAFVVAVWAITAIYMAKRKS